MLRKLVSPSNLYIKVSSISKLYTERLLIIKTACRNDYFNDQSYCYGTCKQFILNNHYRNNIAKYPTLENVTSWYCMSIDLFPANTYNI